MPGFNVIIIIIVVGVSDSIIFRLWLLLSVVSARKRNIWFLISQKCEGEVNHFRWYQYLLTNK